MKLKIEDIEKLEESIKTSSKVEGVDVDSLECCIKDVSINVNEKDVLW